MNKLSLYITIAAFLFAFSSCIKDEMPELEEPTTTDIGLFVNEVFSTGSPDWFELYNSTDEDIDINGFSVSDGPAPKYTFSASTIVPANGYFVFMCDQGFSLSSGGEEIYIWDIEGNEVDHVTFPALDAGVAYGRVSDGADEFSTMAPTQGAANSNVNEAPFIDASPITGINDNEPYIYEIVASDASGIRDVKLFIETGENVYFVEMAPLGGGDFIYHIPAMAAGTEAEYYIVATDETGKKSYYPETAPDTKATFTVADGLVKFVDVALSTENPGGGEDVGFTVTVYDAGGVDDVTLYYVINDGPTGVLDDDKTSIDLTDNGDGTWSGSVPGQVEGTVIRYYLRSKDMAGQKSYYPVETEGGDFDHDVLATWPSVTVAPLVILDALVINEILGTGSPDYIELYNGTSSAIDISGYKVSDSGASYTIPASTVIAAGGFYVILADDGVTMAPFKVSSGGEDITLRDASDNIVDQLLLADWPADHVGLVGRKVDGAEKWVALTTPTQGTSNN